MKNTITLLALLFVSGWMLAQNITITGNVSDDTSPLPGVNVYSSKASKGTQTDFDGNYEIQVQVGDTLIFSYIGYITQEHKITDKTKELNVQLLVDNTTLDEVIVTAQGIKKESRALGYAVSSLSRRDRRRFRRRSEADVARVLSGKASGVQITSQSGTSGAGTQVVIRGYNSIHGNTGSTVAVEESYAKIEENTFKSVATAPLSTFSIDVDKAGYSNVRRMINNGQRIPQDAVKIEEMVNYFAYNYKQPTGAHPFSIDTEMANSPWNAQTKLVKIGLRGRDIDADKVPASNLVFLLDVSGSMGAPNKLPLLKSALEVLVNQLREKDNVSIVVYAGAAGQVLAPTSGANKEEILAAINRLSSGGSTAGGAGIQLAYKIAKENFIDGGNNRVILATDGDFNVGASSDTAMEDLIVEKRKDGIFLTVLGFGMGNYKDSKMETLADKGNGNHAYIDSMQEARKVLGTEFFGTLYTIAKDVKIQVEFNPSLVQGYRLIGYENRLLADEDFNDDTKDAGELGSGHTVTALYEIIPTGVSSEFLKTIDPLKYKVPVATSASNELLTVKFRYKEPDGKVSKLIVNTLIDYNRNWKDASSDFKFAAAVALFGQQLRASKFINTESKVDVIRMAQSGLGVDPEGYRAEFVRLVKSYSL